MIYASVWSKKDATSGNKVSVMRLLIVGPRGELIFEDSDERTLGRYPGRSSKSKVKDLVRAYAKLQLEGLQGVGEISLSNIALRDRSEIEDILSRIKSGRYETLRDLR